MKYKHKFTGEEVKIYNEIYYITTETACIPKRFIENTGDWEKIIELDYEILKSCPIEGTIYSVKRLSDGEVFTVGDCKIHSFYMDKFIFGARVENSFIAIKDLVKEARLYTEEEMVRALEHWGLCYVGIQHINKFLNKE